MPNDLSHPKTTAPAPDIIARLSAACVGHPAARIPWPHRLLHEARDEIERLRSEVIRLNGVIEPTGSRGF
jgi:hypothetical protein